MFIRKVPHKDKKNRKEYFTYKLVESVRTERGPRQRDVLNLGVGFKLPMEQWKDLANGSITGLLMVSESFITEKIIKKRRKVLDIRFDHLYSIIKYSERWQVIRWNRCVWRDFVAELSPGSK